jgi:RNA polymerase sigma-70 factor, ECF subfamily
MGRRRGADAGDAMLSYVGAQAPSMTLDPRHLWNGFHDALRSFIARRVANPADAEDALQEVFIRVQRSIGEVEAEDRIDAWLYQITRNVIADHYRSPAARRQKADAAELDELPAPADEPNEAPAALRSLSKCLRPFVEALPEIYRRALVLTELQGMTQAAAAEELGISLAAMKGRVRRGRALLKRSFLGCCKIDLDARGAVVDFKPRRGKSGNSGPC